MVCLRRRQKSGGTYYLFNEQNNLAMELGLEYQLFFASNPLENENLITHKTDAFIYVGVDGTQTVRNNFRL